MNRRGCSALWCAACLCALLPVTGSGDEKLTGEVNEKAALTTAPLVPPPITRTSPAVVQVYLNAGYKTMELAPGFNYTFWTFNGTTPGPFIRARVGDTLEVFLSNSDDRGMHHNIDFHASDRDLAEARKCSIPLLEDWSRRASSSSILDFSFIIARRTRWQITSPTACMD